MFIKLSIAKLDLFVETTPGGILKYHIGDILLLLIVVIDEFDDVRMDKFMMHIDLLLRIFVVDLTKEGSTIFMATMSLFSVLRANFT